MKVQKAISLFILIMGIIFIWQSLPILITALASFGFTGLSMMQGDMQSFMLTMQLGILVTALVQGAFGLGLLLKRDKIAQMFFQSATDEIKLSNSKLTLFVIVILVGSAFVLYGLDGLITLSFNKSQNIQNGQAASYTLSSNRDFNPICLIEILAGVLILTRSSELTNKLYEKFMATGGDSETEALSLPKDDQ